MPPSKNPSLIKGQSSLANFFSGGGLVAAKQQQQQQGASNSTSNGGGGSSRSSSGSPKKKRAEKGERAKKETPPPQEVTEVKEKIAVSGYTPSPSKSQNKRVYGGDADEEEQKAAGNPVGTSKGKKAKEKRTNEPEEEEEAEAEMASKYFSGGKNKSDAIALSDDSDEDDFVVDEPKSKSKARGTAASSSSNGNSSNSKAKAKSSPAAKRKPAPVDSEESDFEEEKPAKKAAKSSSSSSAKASPTKGRKASATTAKAKSKKPSDDDDDDDFAMDLDEEEEEPKPKPSASKGKPSAKAEPAEPEAKPKPKFNYAEMQKRLAAGPSAPGSKEIPVGKPGCLAGLTFVFTGQMTSISRDEAQDLAKRYGAKVTGAPSSKTSYVVVGEEPGKSKLEKIDKHGLAKLSEDGFLNLIAERSKGEVKLDDATKRKMAKEKEEIEKAAKNLGPSKGETVYDNALWTVRYAPKDLKDLVGNPGAVTKLRDWLRDWPKNVASGFKKPGKDAMGIFRAVLISGPPGIGKTTAAHVVARLEGYTPIELNASDIRSKKLIESSLQDTINNTSLDGWYRGGKLDKSLSADGVTLSDRTVLIMDEVDGMSGGDRGGIGAINLLIKKTKVPIICICNDSKNPKMKPFERTTFSLKFSKPDAQKVRTRMMTIAFREKLKIPPEVMDQLIQSAQSDIRLVINMLSTWALTNKKAMEFDEGKALGAANAKPGMHTPFTLYSMLSSHGLWAASSKKTLNDKADLYFQDHAFVPLMVQQNYISQNPVRAQKYVGKQKEKAALSLMAKAAESISDGDIVDSMIHSSEQHWSLMPIHGIISCVKPMSYVHGQGNFPMFSSWLGQNSKQQRLTRSAVELQARMRMVASGSRFEIREQYLPYLFDKMIQPLLKSGSDGIDDVIATMDDYYLGTEDREVILELGLGAEKNGEALLKKVPTATKTAFTRKYNASNHPVAFYKGVDSGAKAKKITGEPAPDVEEAFEAEDEVPEEDEGDVAGGDASDDEADISKDKFFKQKKTKGKAKGAGK